MSVSSDCSACLIARLFARLLLSTSDLSLSLTSVALVLLAQHEQLRVLRHAPVLVQQPVLDVVDVGGAVDGGVPLAVDAVVNGALIAIVAREAEGERRLGERDDGANQ